MNSIKSQSIAEFVTPDQLPGVLNETAQTLGAKAALMISDEFGGMDIYLAKWTDDKKKQGQVLSRLIECIGEDKTRRFCQLFDGTHITIPNCKNLIRKMRDQAICAEAERGVKRAVIVRKYGISDRRIRSIISKASH